MASIDTPSHHVAFDQPQRFLAELDHETAGRIIASAADVALIVEDGVIRDVALGNASLVNEGYGESWIGRPWLETVTAESRPKIEDLLRANGTADTHWRQVNHPSSSGLDVPVNYTAVRTHPDRLVAIGRDLRSVAALQQRLVETHQELERDYARMREAEARYQILFATVAQPVLIAEAGTLRIDETNPAAREAFGSDALEGTILVDHFSGGADALVEAIARATRSSAECSVEGLRLRNGAACRAQVSAFRLDVTTYLVVSLRMAEATTLPDSGRSRLTAAIESLPDGLFLTQPDLRIVGVNAAAVRMVQFVDRDQLIGSSLQDFLGRSATELNVLVSGLKSHGVVRNFMTVVRDRFGVEEQVELSAVRAPSESPEDETYGFSVRPVARRLQTVPPIGEALPTSVDQLTGLIGRVPLREIVREATGLIERLCIEAALELTNDNRASAAEMLGLSRQGLYSKLRRFGLAEHNGESE